MLKKTITVPSMIRYMSEWKDYRIPQGHVIIDKGVTGCGYTEYCLRNEENIVLCSPRKLLLENKAEQHRNDKNILYVENDIKNYEDSRSFEEKVRDHIIYCRMSSFPTSIPCKILVTYDSMYRVKAVLKEMGLLDQFKFITDEFQIIFLDSYFKANVEMDFVEVLQDCPNVVYLSATPMLEKYLEKLDEFKDLDYYELDWSKTSVVEKIVIKRKFAKSLTGECSKIIQSYLSGKYEVALTDNNHLVVSKEAVFYFNSISDIIKVIKKNNLKPSLVNIICANDEENKRKLSKLSRDLETEKNNEGKFEIGKIPLKGELNKMFTFCTKTAYVGSDFHSSNARSFVFADPNIESLALDISLDLPQIVGRQRDDSNPFKNDVTIFYRTLRKGNLQNRTEFTRLQEQRRISTENLLRGYLGMPDEIKKEYLRKLKSDIQVSQYSKDFISISKHTNLPVYNKFIEIANERAWEVSQEDYQDKINVTKALENITKDLSEYCDSYERIAQDFLDDFFYKTGIFKEKMKMYCEFMDSYSGNKEIEDIIYFKIKDERFRKYYNYYGTSGCRAVSYEELKLSDGMSDATKGDELSRAIYNFFKVGQKYTKKEIKSGLEIIFRNLNITSRKPKAIDLEKYFKLTRVRITNKETGKLDEGYKLDLL